MLTDDKHPAILYKYLPEDGGLQMLQNETLRFTPAKYLNDPFDCRHSSPMQVTIPILGEEICVTIEHLEDRLNPIFEKVGVCSLCDKPSNLKMWDKYTKHQGICVGIDMAVAGKLCGYDEETKRYVFIKKVKYQQVLPKIDPNDIVSEEKYKGAPESATDFERTQNKINNFLSTKTTQWSYEDEYRLILREGYIPTYRHVDASIKNLIFSVYIGAEFNGDPSNILDLAKTRKFKVYKVKLLSDASDIELEELYDPSKN